VAERRPGVGLLLAAILAAAPAAAADLEGIVVAVDGAAIEILVEGELLPAPGDRAAVSFVPLTGGREAVGTWRIESVADGRARAVPDGKVGQAWPGQPVRIDSANPQQRERPPLQDPWLDRLRAEADAIGPPKPVPDVPPPPASEPAPQTATGGAAPDATATPTPTAPATAEGTASAATATASPAAPTANTGGATPSPARTTVAAVPAKPASPVAEHEPNDSIEQAAAIPPDAAITGTILPQRDADHYRVQVDRRGELRLIFDRAPPELDMAVRVLKADDGALVWNWQGAKNAGETFDGWADLPAPGAYVLEVRDGYNNAKSNTPYRLRTRFTPVRDPAEPNDVPADATPLTFGDTLAASILPQRDADHYRVAVDRRGELRIAFPQAPAELDMAVRVLKADDGVLVWNWQGAKKAGEAFDGWADLPAPGAYVLEVRDGYNNARSAAPYALHTAFTPVADAAEPNDDIASATPLAFGQAVSAHILPQRDADHYRVAVDRRGELRIAFPQAPPELDMAVRVLKADDGVLVWNWQGAKQAGEAFDGWADLPAPGAYVLEVRDGYNNARSAAPYRLQADFTAVADPAEPNDAIAEATPLAFGQTVAANILPQRDADFYRVTAPGRGTLRLAFPQAPPELDMAVRVLRSDGGLVANWQGAKASGQTFSGSADLPAAGTYLLEVRDGYNNARSPAPYRFTVTFAGG
jgi:hypothetical protein